MASKRVSVIWRVVFFIVMLFMGSNVSARKFLDGNIPVGDGLDVQVDASPLLYKLEVEMEKRFEDFLSSHISNDDPRGGNY